jgi:hypothetical protein
MSEIQDGLLSADAWAAIEPHLPHGRPGARRVDDRRGISGVLHGLTPGTVADIPLAPVLLDTVAPPRRLLADKA